MRIVTISALVFSASALLGPLIRLVTYPPANVSPGAVNNFIYDLVFLLWPMQSLAVMEVNTGRTVAVVVAVAANILLFGIIGLAVGISASRHFGFVVAYLLVCVLVSILALWGAGFSFAHLNAFALIAALVVYGATFWATARAVGR